MMTRSPLGDFAVQLFMDDCAGAELVRLMLYTLTPTQRDQLRWAVQKRELLARGFTPGQAMVIIGRQAFGERYDVGQARNAFDNALSGNAGKQVTRAADLMFARLSDDQKRNLIPDPLDFRGSIAACEPVSSEDRNTNSNPDGSLICHAYSK